MNYDWFAFCSARFLRFFFCSLVASSHLTLIRPSVRSVRLNWINDFGIGNKADRTSDTWCLGALVQVVWWPNLIPLWGKQLFKCSVCDGKEATGGKFREPTIQLRWASQAGVVFRTVKLPVFKFDGLCCSSRTGLILERNMIKLKLCCNALSCQNNSPFNTL